MAGFILKFLLLFILFTYPNYADIDAQIQAIQNASVKDRFKLMNAFKKRLMKMQEKERIEAVKKLSKNSKKKHAKKVLKELEENTKRANIQKHIEHQQMTEDTINNNLDLFEEGEYDD
ncbi:MAG: hypothetical protein Q9M39_07685 [Sulfurovum sp.]|nr:hypothetical protein [Sulfurovum sp.]